MGVKEVGITLDKGLFSQLELDLPGTSRTNLWTVDDTLARNQCKIMVFVAVNLEQLEGVVHYIVCNQRPKMLRMFFTRMPAT